VIETDFECSGAGIGGLVLAVTIGKFADRDVQIDLYEAHDAITTAVTGIVVSRHIREVMEVLGLYQEVIRVSAEPPSSSSGLSSVVCPPCLTIFVPPGPRFRKSDISQGGFEWFHHILQQRKSTRPFGNNGTKLIDYCRQSRY